MPRFRLIARLLASAVLLQLPTAQALDEPLAWPACIDALRADLPRHPDITVATFDEHTRSAQDLRPPIDTATRTQPEFELPIWDYLDRLVSPQRIDTGRAILEREHAALQRIAAQHLVDPALLVAVLGVESDYGRVLGRYKVVDATLSRACLRLDSTDRRAQFFAALRLLQRGAVQPDRFSGSWAGAFGMTQFMPATHLRHMADGDGDGAIDTVASLPDALATTANYLHSLGWSNAMPWGIEVRAPERIAGELSSTQGEHACLSGARPDGRCRRLAEWDALGVRRIDGRPLGSAIDEWAGLGHATSTALLAPAGPKGPAWLVTSNFQAIWQYNRADAYALAIGLLASALRGEGGVVAAWPVDDPARPLSRTGLLALQSLLRESGDCALDVDGYDGPMTRRAIREEERRRSLPETGRPTTTLLELLRNQPLPSRRDCRPAAAAAR